MHVWEGGSTCLITVPKLTHTCARFQGRESGHVRLLRAAHQSEELSGRPCRLHRFILKLRGRQSLSSSKSKRSCLPTLSSRKVCEAHLQRWRFPLGRPAISEFLIPCYLCTPWLTKICKSPGLSPFSFSTFTILHEERPLLDQAIV